MNLASQVLKAVFEKPEHCVLAFLILIALQACGNEQPYQVFSGRIMGTTWSVQLAEAIKTTEQQQAVDKIAQLLADVDQSMSTYKQDSELSRINAAGLGSYPLSAPLFSVLQLAKNINQRSDGAFDVTIGPLVNLWGFGSGAAPAAVPEQSRIDALLANTGMQGLELDATARHLLVKQSVQMDLSAIAKGYAVDRVALGLIKAGLRNFLVEVGGELRASGVNKNGNHWVIGIETPVQSRRQAYSGVMLKHKSIATSGDYRNFFEVEGKRYSHTLDPRSGYPVAHTLASVSVIADSAAAADAWATALNVLGPEQGMKRAEQEQLAAFFIVRDGESFVARESSAYKAYTEDLAGDAK
ncbi:MAG: FAD:protein FMN transferase [Pseudomonadales bacterium]